MSSDSSSESDSDATSSFEGARRYVRGTFYPARIGECIQKWRVQSKLGFGRFSTAWACSGAHEPATRYPTHALKIARSDDARWKDEVDALTRVGAHPCVVRLETSFDFNANRRTFGCIVSSLHGQPLSRLTAHMKHKGAPIDREILRGIARDAAAGLAHVHGSGYLHTDIKPENILLSAALSHALLGDAPDLRVYVSRRRGACVVPRPFAASAAAHPALGVELGSFCVLADLGNAEKRGAFPPEPGCIQPTCYRAPEVVLFLPHDSAADVFGLGIALYEAATTRYLVDTDAESERDESVQHVTQLRAALGDLPEWMVEAARPVFSREELTSAAAHAPTALADAELAQVLAAMLRMDPRARCSARDATDLLDPLVDRAMRA
jgi:serine/threonine protein kinase